MRTIPEVMHILKIVRNKRGIAVSQVADYILKKTNIYISQKTIYGWEEGRSKPDILCFMAMCDLYQIKDIKELFSGEATLIDVDIVLRDALYKAYVERIEVQEAARILLGME